MSKKNKSSFMDSLPSAVKGIIAIMLTLLVVIIVTMIFAKSLFFTNTNDDNKKTGRVTEAASVSVTEKTTTSKKETKKKTTTSKQDEEDPYGTDSEALGDATTKTVISAVYMHPEPNSSSENLLVIPVGAEVKVYKNENGWLYLDYNGQMGYAYYTFFN